MTKQLPSIDSLAGSMPELGETEGQELTRLRRENQVMREVLQEIVHGWEGLWDQDPSYCWQHTMLDRAREVLTNGKGEEC